MKYGLPAALCVGLLMFAGAVQLQAAGAPVRATLANPSVRLWYEATGRLSDNIASKRDLNLWNTIIGEGAAEEPANDALFTIEVHAQGEQNVSQPLTMSVANASGKVLASRTLRNVLTSNAGRMTAALWVRDLGCAGAVTFAAQMGASRQTAHLSFDCGE